MPKEAFLFQEPILTSSRFSLKSGLPASGQLPDEPSETWLLRFPVFDIPVQRHFGYLQLPTDLWNRDVRIVIEFLQELYFLGSEGFGSAAFSSFGSGNTQSKLRLFSHHSL